MRLHPGKTEAPVRCEYHKEAQLFHNGSQLMARAPQTETGQRRPSRGEGPVEALAGTCPSAPEEATPGPCPRTRYAKPRTEAECSAAEHGRALHPCTSLKLTYNLGRGVSPRQRRRKERHRLRSDRQAG